MTKKYNQSITILAFCSALIDFLVTVPPEMIYPRDRIIHILISAVGFMFIAYLTDKINFYNKFFRITAFLLISVKIIFMVYRYSEYTRMLYGNSTWEIIFFTAAVFVMVQRINDNSIGQVGSFYIFANVLLFILLIVSAHRMKAINIYSLNNTFEFSAGKLFWFFDVFTISVMTENTKAKKSSQKQYIALSTAVFMIITVIQGLNIKGNLLYSLSPLQSLMQIFSGTTVKRYDYIFNLFFTFDYLGAIIMYSAALKKIYGLEGNVEKS